MSKTIFLDSDKGISPILKDAESDSTAVLDCRSPVHVVYGGAHLFKSDTPERLGKRAIQSLDEYASDFIEFAHSMALPGAASLSRMPNAAERLRAQISKNPNRARSRDFPAWFAWTVYTRTLEKLRAEPVEDYRIDFEDGYGFRTDEEEDAHASAAASELAEAFRTQKQTPFCGIRVKSFGTATRKRAERTLDIFLRKLIQSAHGKLPDNFAVTLPKVTNKKLVKELCSILVQYEKQAGLGKNIIDVEIMVETPEAIFDEKGRVPLRGFVKAAGKRRVSAHFGAYDYTSALSIAAPFQNIRHSSCDFARSVMLTSLAPLDIRLSDSVTTVLPVPIHRGDNLSEGQKSENRRTIQNGWRIHFENVTNSMSAGFYQSWDLHPHQLPARYAAVYSFFLYNCDAQARRLKAFVERATQATLSGTAFDDAASARGVLNFFRRALGCKALTPEEVNAATGLAAEQIYALSFADFANPRSKPS